MLPNLKKRYPWLSDVSSVPVQQSLRHLDRAYKNFFEGRADSIPPSRKDAIRREDLCLKRLHPGKMASSNLKMEQPLAITFHRALPNDYKLSLVTISKDSAPA